MTAETLRARLSYEPHELAFGTSGLRGLVTDITNLEAYINTLGFLRWLFGMAPSAGGTRPGEVVYFAHDLRPSSDHVVESQQGRGDIAQAVVRAIRDAGCEPVNLGKIPTPALTYHAIRHNKASVMITGSHIPFDRNGIKFNKANGEVLKRDEAGILAQVTTVRRDVYGRPFEGSLFDERGMLRPEKRPLLPTEDAAGRQAYLRRYTSFFANRRLEGRRLLLYQHSALARDMLVELLSELGADVVPTGRSETFVPIDTEDIGAAELATLQQLVDEAGGGFDAILSTDGDSDRPLVVSVESGKVRFHGGDLLGTVVAKFLDADAIAVPISANDAVDQVFGNKLLARTKIGSPYVIARMLEARGRRRVVGFEANGGFLTGSDFEEDGRVLHALPTRDAVLPMLSVLFAAEGGPIGRLFDELPPRFSKAGLLDNFAVATSRKIIAAYSPAPEAEVERIEFGGNEVDAYAVDGAVAAMPGADEQRLRHAREEIETLFDAAHGFGRLVSINYVDGLRMTFDNHDVAHVRPSGNAPQLRIYANADTQQRADAIVAEGIKEPDGILRRMEKSIEALRH